MVNYSNFHNLNKFLKLCKKLLLNNNYRKRTDALGLQIIYIEFHVMLQSKVVT